LAELSTPFLIPFNLLDTNIRHVYLMCHIPRERSDVIAKFDTLATIVFSRFSQEWTHPVITQHTVQPIKRAPAKPAKVTFLRRLKIYAKALIKPLRFSSSTTPKPPTIEWTPQSAGRLRCGHQESFLRN